MWPYIQNYFVQVTVTKGKIIDNGDGTTTKEVDETVMDSVFCKDTDIDIIPVTDAIQEDVDQLLSN